jgi:hypothetical protein
MLWVPIGFAATENKVPDLESWWSFYKESWMHGQMQVAGHGVQLIIERCHQVVVARIDRGKEG